MTLNDPEPGCQGHSTLSIVQLQTIHLLNLQCIGLLTHSPLAMAETLVTNSKPCNDTFTNKSQCTATVCIQNTLAWDTSVCCWQHWLHGSMSGCRLNCSSSLHELHNRLDENPLLWQNSTPTSDPVASLHQISNNACKHTLNNCTVIEVMSAIQAHM